MEFYNNSIYHIYNQGNNRETTYRDIDDYFEFLRKLDFHLKPTCTILSYCLMPNHFHVIILTTEKSNEKVKIGSLELTRITNAFRLILSEYAQDFNKKYNRSGSLFRQKTKYKLADNMEPQYLKNLIYYVLSNPFDIKDVNKLEDWHFSSFRDLLGLRNGRLIDKELCKEVFQLTVEDLNDFNNGYSDPLYLKK
ncbi:transposase [Lacihabitans soyangensis]|uniref:Transposase n=1 Tax=Lacihabitans soyangensis TaxID=869394 RepID=A0AAE3H807_9BACT|nr:transposase [Lacihabitans soyangensis]MCP9765935.1 transposase [Lacihabitans soyangensis]